MLSLVTRLDPAPTVRSGGMKTVILAGGMGTRLSEETSVRPKPMVEIGGMPILWHIMKI
jgi:NDP-sugar pyrophosphorylase family protein